MFLSLPNRTIYSFGYRHTHTQQPTTSPLSPFRVRLYVCMLAFSLTLRFPRPPSARVRLLSKKVAPRDALLPLRSSDLPPHASTLVPWEPDWQGWGWAGVVVVLCWQPRPCRCQSSPRAGSSTAAAEAAAAPARKLSSTFGGAKVFVSVGAKLAYLGAPRSFSRLVDGMLTYPAGFFLQGSSSRTHG